MNVQIQNYITGKTAVKIAQGIEQAILRGNLPAGTQLPPVRDLAQELSISPATVASAYRRLKQRGLILTGRRRGTHVRELEKPVLEPRPAARSRLCDLATGNPDRSFLPPLGQALARISREPRLYDEGLVHPRLRQFASEQLAADGIPVEHLAVVGGALDGLERVLRESLRPGDRVLVEDPCFSGVRDLLLGESLEPVAVAMDEEGMRPEALEAAFVAGPQAVVITPRAQNPTGATLTAERAKALREVLQKAPDLLVVEDDHAGPVAGAKLFSVCAGGRSHWTHLRSMSKSLGPDLRVAILAGDQETVLRVQGRQQIGIRWVSHVLQELVAELGSNPEVQQLCEQAATAYGERRQALLAALLEEGVVGMGRSGLNVWIPVPDECAAVRYLAEQGYAVQGGARCRLKSAPGIRVTTAAFGCEHAKELARQIALAVQPSLAV